MTPPPPVCRGFAVNGFACGVRRNCTQRRKAAKIAREKTRSSLCLCVLRVFVRTMANSPAAGAPPSEAPFRRRFLEHGFASGVRNLTHQDTKTTKTQRTLLDSVSFASLRLCVFARTTAGCPGAAVSPAEAPNRCECFPGVLSVLCVFVRTMAGCPGAAVRPAEAPYRCEFFKGFPGIFSVLCVFARTMAGCPGAAVSPANALYCQAVGGPR